MSRSQPLPDALGSSFAVGEARALGVRAGRLRGSDLLRPYSGLRTRRSADVPDHDEDPFAAQRRIRVEQALAYAPRLRPGQYFSHETAAALWGGPLPIVREDRVVGVHVSTLGEGPLVRAVGVERHRGDPRFVRVRTDLGVPVASPASTWTQMGHLPLFALVALGDCFCRMWRPGVGRPHAGKPPLATVAQLRADIGAGRRLGAPMLREAIEWIREDSWSPRESELRCLIVAAGLPEPLLNVDLFDGSTFLGCVDMVYPERKVAIEYLGRVHANSWGADVERLARLRAAGWTVIEVTAELIADPPELLGRIRRALGF
ncbi:endonuclease domain-containing protein [Microbacterium sp. 2MCAF23]|uniref:endonuclease domain-containing protein n=1 Tax=Microbacterium sp. 2MCAF23 TaxID=3232985 RepID=UPI003F9CD2CF